MNWDDIWKFAVAILTSVGGIGGIIIIVVKFSAKQIAKKLEAQYSLKLNKELEKYKSSLDSKIHISKTKFDAEFLMYRELSQAFAILVKTCYQLFPTFTKDARNDYDKYKSIHDKCVDAIIIVQDKLDSYAPFISDKIFDKYYELELLCKKQLGDFQDFRLRPDPEDFRRECKEAYNETYKRTKIIEEKYRNILNDLRAYINSIDVIE